MEGEQFSLCWNNFHSNLSSGFNSLLKDEDLVDVTIAAGGKFLKAHKTILSVCSPFFKDLFRANPSDHPIVILPDVNYNSLASLLQFMYQGEVSVSQEEIPMFMRVAEMLKVKGLTDNNSQSESNGVESKSPFNTSEARPIMKRPRPIKKLIKPLQPLRPIETTTPSPKPATPPQHQPPPPKKMHYADISVTDQPVSLRKPKEEPPDRHNDHDNVVSLLPGNPYEDSVDLSGFSDGKLGSGESLHQWQQSGEHADPNSSTPGTLQCILGKRGNPRLIVDGHAFYKKSVYKGKGFWYCKMGRITEKCPAVCWTLNGNIVKWPGGHTHPVIPDPFNPEEDTEVPIENLQEVLWESSYNY